MIFDVARCGQRDSQWGVVWSIWDGGGRTAEMRDVSTDARYILLAEAATEASVRG